MMILVFLTKKWPIFLTMFFNTSVSDVIVISTNKIKGSEMNEKQYPGAGLSGRQNRLK